MRLGRSRFRPLLFLNCGVLLSGLLGPDRTEAQPTSLELSHRERLGRRLFFEIRFSNPGANFMASCATCHKPRTFEGKPSFSDPVARSLVPSPSRGLKVTTLRNAPTLFDVSEMQRLYHDGRFVSLLALIESELTGRHMGWAPREKERALDEIHTVLMIDAGVDAIAEGTYEEEFKRAFEVDVPGLTKRQALRQVATSIAEYLATVRTTRTAPWDAFASVNAIAPGPTPDESPEVYAGRVLARLADRKSRGTAKPAQGLDAEASRGLKIFFATQGEDSVGNCVACHFPPAFTDFRFHNVGTAQMEYDALHGDGSFEALEAPVIERGTVRFLTPPRADRAGFADLGYWNHVPAQDPSEIEHALGAFKTPTLRNLSATAPYLHNGSAATLQEAVRAKLLAGRLARDGLLRNPDPALLAMRLTEEDVAPLVSFLRSLDEVGRDEFDALVLSIRNRSADLDE